MKDKFVSLINSVRHAWPSVRRIWNGYGYYISLALLLTIFGTVAYMYRTGAAGNYVADNDDAGEYRAAMAYSTPAPTSTPQPEEGLLMPVSGEILSEYAPDELIWNHTLGQWRSHPGVDIAAAQGSTVSACADGCITAAYEDAIYGNIAEITHDDGSVSRVSPLLSLELVTVGRQVRRGDIIGCVGPSSLLESAMDSHIHFEISKDGASIEPVFEENP